MAGRLAGKVAIVTGGGHGIGKAYALGLAGEGAKVVVAEIDAIAAGTVAADLKSRGFEAIAVRTDVADPASVEAMVKGAVGAFGRIDILVNNAAIFATVPMSRSPFDEIEIEEWDRMMAVNLRGMWLASRAAVPHMRKRGYGKIINISSGTALKGPASRLHYAPSKAGGLGCARPPGPAPCETYTSFRSRLETALPTSEFSRDTMSAGRRAGPTTPIHAVVSKPGNPDSARVGTSGKRAMRFALVTASTLTFPALACGRGVLTTSNL